MVASVREKWQIRDNHPGTINQDLVDPFGTDEDCKNAMAQLEICHRISPYAIWAPIYLNFVTLKVFVISIFFELCSNFEYADV